MAEKNPTVDALNRLKRRFGRELAMLEREAADTGAPRPYRYRRQCEANQWAVAMSMLDAEIRKAK